MDIDTIIRSSVLGELNNHLGNYPSFVRPLLGMIVGALIMKFLNFIMRRSEEKAEKVRHNWDNFWLRFGRASENSMIFTYEELKAEKDTFITSRCSPGFPELASFVMNRVDKAGECYRLSYRDDTYISKNIRNYRLYPECDIYVDMLTDSVIQDGVALLRSKMMLRSRSHSVQYLHKMIQQIIADVNLDSHDGSLWAYMVHFSEGSVQQRRMKLNTNKNWNHLIMNARQKNILYTYLNRFQDKSWYINAGIPYKATFLLYGPPGTGKTTIIKILAEQYRRHVVLFTLKSIKNGEFMEMFYDYRFRDNLDRFIYVFEDIDADTRAVWSRDFRDSMKPVRDVEEDKVKVKESKLEDGNSSTELTLATILQTLDGVIENTGLMVVATTNHYERLDPAFIRRFHCRLELSYCCLETANMIAERFFDCNFSNEEWEQCGSFVEKKTPNNLIEIATSAQDWKFFLQELQK